MDFRAFQERAGKTPRCLDELAHHTAAEKDIRFLSPALHAPFQDVTDLIREALHFHFPLAREM